MQLAMGAALLGHARAVLDDRRVSNRELRFLAERLAEALRDVLRVAEGRRIGAVPPSEGRGDGPGQGPGG
ncbi:hypothetical protein [Streptomyces sp. C10]|uniref:hypothetical protein n=1 Tax=Streptomyces sp. C10 TaxID=531941 RepID=UPI0039814C6E